MVTLGADLGLGRRLEAATVIIFSQEGTVTNPAMWLVLSAVRIFLSLTTVTVTAGYSAGEIVMLSKFSWMNYRWSSIFLFFTLPWTINQRKFTSVHFLIAGKVTVSKFDWIFCSGWEFVWLFVARRWSLLYLKWYYWWSKTHFLFFFRFWKRILQTSNWQNFELCVLSEGCLFWV